MFRRWMILPLAAALAGLSGCVIIDTHTGPPKHETASFDRDSVERLRVDLRIGAGELTVRGGSAKLAEAAFDFNVDSWRPNVRYHPFGSSGELTIEQPGSSHAHLGNATNKWDVQLTDNLPVELITHFGAGESRMDLGTLDLRRVEVNMGVGQLDMDLRGHPKHNYDVSIHGGVGQATVRLPRDAGVYATGHGGIGDIHTEGLSREGDHWVNDAYRTSPIRIHVDVQGGIGEIRLIQ